MAQVLVVMFHEGEIERSCETVASVLNQSFSDYELWLIVSGDQHPDAEVFNPGNDPRIRVVESRNRKKCVILNDCLLAAKAAYITVINSGDRLHDEKLRIQVKRLTAKPDIAVSASWSRPYTPSGSSLAPFRLMNEYVDRPLLKLLDGNFMDPSSVIIKISFLMDNKIRFCEANNMVMFYRLWIDIAKQGGIFFIEPQFLIYSLLLQDQGSDDVSSMYEESKVLKKELMTYLLDDSGTVLKDLHEQMLFLEKENVITFEMRQSFFGRILSSNPKEKLKSFN